MLYRILFFLYLVFFSNLSNAQNYISVSNLYNGKRSQLTEGNKLKVKLLKGTKFSGIISEINDSTIFIERDTFLTEVNLSEIDWIKFHSDKFLGKFIRRSSLSIMAGGPFYLLLNRINGGFRNEGLNIPQRHMNVAMYITLAGLTMYGIYEVFYHKRHKANRYKIQLVSFAGL